MFVSFVAYLGFLSYLDSMVLTKHKHIRVPSRITGPHNSCVPYHSRPSFSQSRALTASPTTDKLFRSSPALRLPRTNAHCSAAFFPRLFHPDFTSGAMRYRCPITSDIFRKFQTG